jgi:hypothetical protein
MRPAVAAMVVAVEVAARFALVMIPPIIW